MSIQLLKCINLDQSGRLTLPSIEPCNYPDNKCKVSTKTFLLYIKYIHIVLTLYNNVYNTGNKQGLDLDVSQ